MGPGYSEEEVVDVYYGDDSVVWYDADEEQHCTTSESWEG